MAELPAPVAPAPVADPEGGNEPANSAPPEPAQALADGDKKENDLKEGEAAEDVNVALKKRVETLDPSK